VPDSPRFLGALLVLGVTAVIAGCGATPSIDIPSIPTFPDVSKSGGASFDIDGNTFQVSQSGSIHTDFGRNPLSYSGPDGCAGHYFSADYTEDIQVFFRYFRDRAYLLIDNGSGTIYVFGPPKQRGKTLVFSNAAPRDRKITVTVTCPGGA
jgi:hypothetical protein